MCVLFVGRWGKDAGIQNGDDSSRGELVVAIEGCAKEEEIEGVFEVCEGEYYVLVAGIGVIIGFW